jgi:hypothetical protein
MSGDLRNVFISHIHENDDRLGPLKDLLGKHGCSVRDSSINSEKPNNASDPDYIMREILQPRIDWASALIVLVTADTKDSNWVNKEIEYAHQQGKQIIGVWDHGHAGCELPEKLDEYADQMVAWRGEQVVDALEGRLDGWRDPDGNPMPDRTIARYRC